jgi:hypothetical protein
VRQERCVRKVLRPTWRPPAISSAEPAGRLRRAVLLVAAIVAVGCATAGPSAQRVVITKNASEVAFCTPLLAVGGDLRQEAMAQGADYVLLYPKGRFAPVCPGHGDFYCRGIALACHTAPPPRVAAEVRLRERAQTVRLTKVADAVKGCRFLTNVSARSELTGGAQALAQYEAARAGGDVVFVDSEADQQWQATSGRQIALGLVTGLWFNSNHSATSLEGEAYDCQASPSISNEPPRTQGSAQGQTIPTQALAAHLYDLGGGPTVEAGFAWTGSGHGSVTVVLPTGNRCVGEYTTLAGANPGWGSLYAKVFGPVGSDNSVQRGSAIASGSDGTLIQCEYITEGSVQGVRGQGVCSESHSPDGKDRLWKLMF